jgi:FMN phosphatase YigB (HAD superfamily)
MSEIPKIVFVDWDGTLSNSRFWGHLITEDPDGYDKIQKSLFVGNSSLLHQWMRGFITVEHVIDHLSDITNLDPQHLFSNLEKSCRAMEFMHTETLEVIKEKRSQGMKVVIATDNMDTFSRWTVPSLQLHDHFDGILTSVARSALKGEVDKSGRSLFFQHFLNQNGVRPNQSLLIDNSDFANVANSIGMHFQRVTPEFSVIDALRTLQN